MHLSQLLNDIYTLPHSIDVEIKRMTIDSRSINSRSTKPSDLFIAIRGIHSDGRQFITQAIENGAAAVLVELDLVESDSDSGSDSDADTDPDADADNEVVSIKDRLVPVIPIKNLRNRLGELAARFYAFPAKKLRVLGVTGTNGKTSCSHYIAQALSEENIRCGIIGTLGYGFYDHLQTTGLTTPDALTLQSLLNDFCQKEAQAISMEVSSHSIDQGRINAIDFALGIFTNLTQDHLDYHGSMEVYAAVKKSFLESEATQQLIINADDPYGAKWIAELKTKKPVFAYGFKNLSHPNTTYARNIKFSSANITADISSPWGQGELTTPLIGDFNLSNVLAALTALCVYGVPFDRALAHLAKLKPVAGRMQHIRMQKSDPTIVVDYAHTKDALEKVLRTLHAQHYQRLICVFGCGGDRDHGKRAQMAEIAERYADIVIITNDNPRGERPEKIVADIMRGFTRPEHVIIELNRAKAIQKSIQLAKTQDCILVAGKGAENYQQIGNDKIPFDDAEVVRHFLGERLSVPLE